MEFKKMTKRDFEEFEKEFNEEFGEPVEYEVEDVYIPPRKPYTYKDALGEVNEKIASEDAELLLINNSINAVKNARYCPSKPLLDMLIDRYKEKGGDMKDIVISRLSDSKSNNQDSFMVCNTKYHEQMATYYKERGFGVSVYEA